MSVATSVSKWPKELHYGQLVWFGYKFNPLENVKECYIICEINTHSKYFAHVLHVFPLVEVYFWEFSILIDLDLLKRSHSGIF